MVGRCESCLLPFLYLNLGAGLGARGNGGERGRKADRSRYLKCIDRFYNNYVSCFVTGGSLSPLFPVTKSF